MRKLSACLVAAILSVAPTTSALAGPGSTDPWKHVEAFEWSTSRGRLGVMVISMTRELRGYFGAPAERGVLVAKVEPGSPAAKAGIKVGDVITEVRGEAVDDASDVISALSGVSQGDKVDVDLVRERKPLELSATMDASTSSLQSLQWLRQAIPWFDWNKWPQKSSST